MDTRPVNLAAARVTERQICKRLLARRLQIVGFLLIVDMLVLTVGGVWMRSLASRQQILTKRAQSTLATTKRLQMELANLKQEQDLVLWNRKLSIQSRAWLDAIDELIVCMPSESWLSRLETVPGSGSIKVDGGAVDMQSVHQIASRISRTGAFTNLKLGSIEALLVDNGSAVRFSLSCRIQAIQPATPAADGATEQPATAAVTAPPEART